MYNRRIFLLIVLSICFLLGMATRKEKENVEKMVDSTTAEESKGNVEATTTVGGTTGGTMMNESGKGTEVEEAPLIKPEEEPALYKTEISSITPKSGITTGHVIAYGHYIKPPYKVEVRSDTMLFINGVQIFPRLPSKYEIEEKRREQIAVEEYEKAHPMLKTYMERRASLFTKMRRVYIVLETKIGRDKAVDSVLKIAEANTLFVVLDTTAVGKDDYTINVEYFFPGDDHPTEYLLDLHGGDPSSGYRPSPKPWRQDFEVMKEMASRFKEETEEDLRDNEVIIYTYRSRCFRSEYDLWRILEILKSDTLDMKEKIEKLDRFAAGEEESSKELIYNFVPSEWPSKKEGDKK